MVMDNIEDVIVERFESGVIGVFDRGCLVVDGFEFEFFAEGWRAACFDKGELDGVGRGGYRLLVCDKADSIVEGEGWDGFVYLSPCHDAPYGVTCFYREK